MFPYAPPDTRPTPVWALVMLLFAFWVLAQVAVLPFALPVLLATGGEVTPASMMWIILLTLLVGGAMLAAGPIIWAGRRELRDLPGLGIRLDPYGWRQYGRGWWIGALYWFALVLLAALLTHVLGRAGANEVQADWSRLGDPGLIALLLALLPLFILQGASEEILCRGWLLTNLTARVGLVRGVIGSSLLFACMHPQYFFNQGMRFSSQQVLIGTVGLLAIFTMGVAFAMLSLRDRSIMGAAGMHSAFNYLLVGSGMVFSHVTSDQPGIATVFVQSFANSTDLDSIQLPLIIQILLSASVAGFLFWKFGLPKPEETGSDQVFR